MILKIKQLLFLINTIIYYTFHNRGIYYHDGEASGYSYKNKCAIGRHMTLETREQCPNKSVNILPVKFIPRQLLKLGIPFLYKVQYLHDTNDFWKDKRGINSQGIRAAILITRTIFTKDGFDREMLY